MVDRHSSDARSVKLRGFYASLVAGQSAAASSRIAAAFAAVPREPFAGPGPWLILASNVRRSRDRRSPDVFAQGRMTEIRAIRLGGKPDASCWYDGGAWWLSTRAP